MQESESEEFKVRMGALAAGRQWHPWLEGIGWNRSDVTRARAGKIPGAEKLRELAKKENVSLSWLIAGVGPSHVVHGVVRSPSPLSIREEPVNWVNNPDGGADEPDFVFMGEDGSRVFVQVKSVLDAVHRRLITAVQGLDRESADAVLTIVTRMLSR